MGVGGWNEGQRLQWKPIVGHNLCCPCNHRGTLSPFCSDDWATALHVSSAVHHLQMYFDLTATYSELDPQVPGSEKNHSTILRRAFEFVRNTQVQGNVVDRERFARSQLAAN